MKRGFDVNNMIRDALERRARGLRGVVSRGDARDGGESGTVYVAVIFYGLSRVTLPC